MNDRRSGEERRRSERRELTIEVPQERRLFERRQDERREDDEQSRRQVFDRRVQAVPVENDRRKGSRRSAERAAIANSVGPDWMEEALNEAAKRQQEMPAMVPPPVSIEENELINKKLSGGKTDYNFEIGIGFFIFVSLLGVIYILMTT